jgi:molybdate transport system ATP-binding protein
MAVELVAEFRKSFRQGARIDCSLRLDGGTTVLFGPSGAGKTTILRCLAGLERPEEGRIRFGEETWFDAASGLSVSPQERGLGLLFQSHALFPHLTVQENVAYGLGSQGGREERTGAVLRLLRLESLRDRSIQGLSGGERQRVALARVLAPGPRFLLLDEPLSNLDAPTREELQRELRRLLLDLDVPTLLVTHDRIEALALGDQMAVLSLGRIHQMGAVHDVFSRPKDLEVARIVGVETVLPARVVGGSGDGLLALEVGAVPLSAIDPGNVGEHVFACIRAQEVILETGPVGKVSARNRLPGRVSAVVSEGPLVRVTLECGFSLAALVTRQSQEELGLVPGAEITAIVKSPSVHVIPRDGPSARAAEPDR